VRRVEERREVNVRVAGVWEGRRRRVGRVRAERVKEVPWAKS
jgi:hypothetical protein